ncbi:MAG TPA: type I DNA topoisomerase [Candidatus Paceibacterota bacterium]|jgi:DNA topoisomerase-1|nr:type I DNA topoisomerase [Candidatus Paceibacterota bacterium]HPC37366.1 type I DNA topoisomerase [Candidatus Paceibacterota bacterium]HRU35936.1 type I DNA topoisomerase [Candidatus Paceibacterota bacterium]
MNKKQKSLIIVESPAKAKTISRFLDSNYQVEASYGHIRDLPKSTLGIDTENDFQPKYIIPKNKQKQVTKLKKTTAKSSELILATDEDREGEAIAWHLKEVLISKDFNLPVKRIAFHEITQTAIENALKNPREINENLVLAQQARRILDRLVGYNLSPFLWKKVFKGLSAGRVQSVALRIIVDKENERNQFKPEEYWTIVANFLSSKKEIFQSELYKINNKNLEKFSIKNKEEAEKITNNLKLADFSIKDITEKIIKKTPPPPFITSTLQQEASKKLHFSAKQTMMLAQKLYEGVDFGKGSIGLITYMRTDSVILSNEALKKAEEIILEKFGKNYYQQRQYKNKSRLAQEAHEAIRPTDPQIFPKELKGKIDEKLYKLYNLIWQRFIASQMTDLQIKKLIVDIEGKTPKENYDFKTIGSQIYFDGFSKIYPVQLQENLIPKLFKNEKILLNNLSALQHFTEPPVLYSEASLIKKLEEYGIGRPSTYATIISILLERRYVEKDENRHFITTEIGLLVDSILRNNFPQIVDIGFTAKIEEDLDKIAEGKKNWIQVIREFYEPFKNNLDEKYNQVEKTNLQEETNEICEKCGAKMIIKYGKYGKFLACSNFPECKNTKSLNNKKSLGIVCPKCHQGEIIIKKTKKGRIFYGCSRWPECDFASWTKPKDENLLDSEE